MSKATTGTLHHVELWVPDLPRAVAGWSGCWSELGYIPFQDWSDGRSWRLGSTYLVLEQSPALSADKHDRCRPGLNHLAFHVESRAMVDALAEQAPRHGWTLMFPDRHPHAGGEHHYAAYLEDVDGFEVELVAPETPDEATAAPNESGRIGGGCAVSYPATAFWSRRGARRAACPRISHLVELLARPPSRKRPPSRSPRVTVQLKHLHM